MWLQLIPIAIVLTMKATSQLKTKVPRFIQKYGPVVLLFQRTPATQMLVHETRVLCAPGIMKLAGWSVTTVAGLGAFDSVAGATQVSQVAPARGSSTVPAKTGELLNFIVQVTGAPSKAKSWQVLGKLPAGLKHQNATNSNTNAISGVPAESGNFRVTVRAWEKSNYRGGSKSKAFTITVAQGGSPPAITSQPESRHIAAGETVTLSVVATGSEPSYQWYLGENGDTSNPIAGATESTYQTAPLNAPASYWVRVSNSLGDVNSSTAAISVTDTYSSWQTRHFNAEQLGDPSVSGPLEDPDSDGTVNEDEFIIGTSPLVFDLTPVPEISPGENNVSISFKAVKAAGPGYSGLSRHYALESSDKLDGSDWKPVQDHADITGADQMVTFEANRSPAPAYYRLRIWLTPN